MNSLSHWCIYHVKAFDSIDLKLFMDCDTAFDSVMIIEKPLTGSIYWLILRLLMCLCIKTLWCYVIGCIHDVSSSSVIIVIAIDNFSARWGGVIYEPHIYILRLHRNTIHKDCLTGWNSIITGLIYRKIVSGSDTPGKWYTWIRREIFLEYVLEISHYWTLTDYNGHEQISTG